MRYPLTAGALSLALGGGAHVETLGMKEGLELGGWSPERVYGVVGGTRWVGRVSVLWAARLERRR